MIDVWQTALPVVFVTPRPHFHVVTVAVLYCNIQARVRLDADNRSLGTE